MTDRVGPSSAVEPVGAPRRRKPRRWTFSAGVRGARVTVFERRQGGALWARTWDPGLYGGHGGFRRASLGHRDKAAARAYATAEAAKLEQGTADLLAGRITLAHVFALYQRHHTPRKVPKQQQQDGRRVELWARWFSGDRDPRRILRRELQDFVDARSSGAIDGRGHPVPEDKRKPVRARPVELDVLWLKWVFAWATRWQDEAGRFLLRENPLRGFRPPPEKNVRRPVASTDRYEKLRAVSDQVTMEWRWDGHRRVRRSYLSELLDLAHWTGHRISAITSLQVEDLRLEATDSAPHGAIRWPAATDKQRLERTIPLAPEARAAIGRALSGRSVTAGYLFPSPTDPERPVGKDRARTWLQEAERLAKLEPLEQGAWHPFRRGFASARRHLPLVDLAAAGGWTGTETLTRCYLHADAESILRVVTSPAELREIRPA